ncbi:MAG: hypothetical protein ABFS03_00460 [Chloroflexota bacterium]
MKRNTLLLIVILVWIGVNLACSSSDDTEATAQAITEILSLTATAAVPQAEETENLYLTAQAEATEQVILEPEVDTESLQATAMAESSVIGELKLYGIDPEKGQIGWVHPPVNLEADRYMAFDYANDYPEVIVGDFVIASDITWDTQYGTSGCGYLLRSNGDQNSGDQYMVLITRAGNGHLIFAITENGNPVGGYDVFPRTSDKSFDWHNGTTNRVAIVGKGSTFTFYTNGVWVDEIDLTNPPPAPVMPAIPAIPSDQSNNQLMEIYRQQMAEYENMVEEIRNNFNGLLSRAQQKSPIYEHGFVGLILVSESGHSICQFDNAWLWMMNPEE